MRILTAILLALFALTSNLNLYGFYTDPTRGVVDFFENSPVQHNNQELSLLKKDLLDFINKTQSSKRFNDKQYTLQKVYYHLHRKYLKNYIQYSKLDETYSSGNYDCLTATALYSYVLNELNFSFKIIKSDFHIFLVIENEGNQILLEPTESVNGLISGNQLKEQLKLYAANSQLRTVEIDELSGLLNFNEAVKNYNSGLFTDSFNYLEEALKFTQDASVYSILKYTILNILNSDELSEAEKKNFLKRYLKVYEHQAPLSLSKN